MAEVRPVLFLGFTVPDDVAKRIFELDPIPPIQTHKFGWNFVRCLKAAKAKVYLASSHPVQSYPLVSTLWFPRGKFTAEGCEGVYLFFINIVLVKHLCRLLACFLTITPLILKRKIEWIFVHGVHTPYLLFAVAIGYLLRTRVCVVLTDPPGVILPTDRWLSRALKRLDRVVVGSLVRRADYAVSLSRDLASYLGVDRPILCFPGIADQDWVNASARFQNEPPPLNSEPYTIFYAGGLTRAYGVDRLIDAIALIESPKVQLRLFGAGDQVERIKALASHDEKFYYGGVVDKDIIYPELISATIRINPRPSQSTVAVNSFPSKLIEYLASGRCVLTTRIKSIPPELAPHFDYINDETPLGIKDSIIRILETPEMERTEKGRIARDFVVSNYSVEAIGLAIQGIMGNPPCVKT